MFGFIKGNQWIGFDTPSSIKRKMNYVKNKKLGGAMIWAIDLDDYLGACGSKWPLLSTMNHELRRKKININTCSFNTRYCLFHPCFCQRMMHPGSNDPHS